MGRREDVDNSIWADDGFLDLSAHARYVYLWAFTNPHCNMAGLYKVGRRVMQLETGLTARQIDAALTELADAGMVQVHDGALWVVARIKYLRTKSASIGRAIVKDLEPFAADHPLRVALVRRYSNFPGWLSNELGGLTVVEPKTDTPLTPPEDPGEGSQGRARAGQVVVEPPSTEETADAAPADLADNLVPVAESVKAVLDRVVAAKGGTVAPTLRAVGRVVGQFPRRDHIAEAEKLEHWLVDGNGRNQPNKDIVARYRAWLGNATDVLHPTAAGQRPQRAPRFAAEKLDKYDQVEVRR